jgi:small redox-active disulfide protein 2
MKIQVLGVGCPSCHELFELTKRAAKDLNLKEEVEYLDDIKKIVAMGVMQVPVLAIDGKPVITGAVYDIEKVKDALSGKKVSNDEKNNSGCSCGGRC